MLSSTFIDEAGYVPTAEIGAEYLFQVIADRAEEAAVILTTNLPFSWTKMIPNARRCKALVDRISDQAHIIETRHDRYRFKHHTEAAGNEQLASVVEMPTALTTAPFLQPKTRHPSLRFELPGLGKLSGCGPR